VEEVKETPSFFSSKIVFPKNKTTTVRREKLTGTPEIGHRGRIKTGRR
jgi:hypothetical protein